MSIPPSLTPSSYSQSSVPPPSLVVSGEDGRSGNFFAPETLHVLGELFQFALVQREHLDSRPFVPVEPINLRARQKLEQPDYPSTPGLARRASSRTPEIAQWYYNQGLASKGKGNFIDAIYAHETALDIRRQLFGDADPSVLESLMALMDAYSAQKETPVPPAILHLLKQTIVQEKVPVPSEIIDLLKQIIAKGLEDVSRGAITPRAFFFKLWIGEYPGDGKLKLFFPTTGLEVNLVELLYKALERWAADGADWSLTLALRHNAKEIAVEPALAFALLLPQKDVEESPLEITVNDFFSHPRTVLFADQVQEVLSGPQQALLIKYSLFFRTLWKSISSFIEKNPTVITDLKEVNSDELTGVLEQLTDPSLPFDNVNEATTYLFLADKFQIPVLQQKVIKWLEVWRRNACYF